MKEESSKFTLEEFKDYFRNNFSHISHEISNRKLQTWLDQKYIKDLTLEKTADLFADYLLANGYCNVQE